MNRTDLIVGISPDLGPSVSLFVYSKIYIFNDYTDLDLFSKVNPDLINGVGEYANSNTPYLFLTKSDSDRLGITYIPYKPHYMFYDVRSILTGNAVKNIKTELLKPLQSSDDITTISYFDPWEIFPVFYGSYNFEFDRIALEVLCNLIHSMRELEDDRTRNRHREEIAHEMFREYLCRINLCNYGTSPRVCFLEPPFREIVVALFEKWRAYSVVNWGDYAEENLPKLSP